MAETRIIKGTKLIVAKDKKELSRIAADLILERLRKRPSANLLVATGTTPEGVYSLLRKESPKLFCKASFFNMDEYCEKNGRKFKLVNEKDSKGYRFYMRKHFFAKIKPKASYFPSEEDIKTPGTYDKIIKNRKGIDLCLCAVGEDGHVAFNFPGTKFASVSRLVRLNGNIKKVNKKLTGHDIPDYGVTVGLKTLMESREIIFIVCGERKAGILKRVVSSKKPKVKIPATVLKHHKNCHFIVDREAVSLL
jgi:glucosamine-6-phosphate deaminase